MRSFIKLFGSGKYHPTKTLNVKDIPMDDEDKFELVQKIYMKRQPKELEQQQQLAAKKVKKDFTKSTSFPSTKQTHALIKQTPVRKNLLESTSSPSPNGGKMHALIKQTPVRKNLTKPTSSPSPNGEKMRSVRKAPSPNVAKMKALKKPSALEKGKNVVVSDQPIFAADVSAETSRRPLAAVRKWYNDELEKQDRETWDKFNGCFRAIQSSNTKSASYWLSQLEKSHTSLQRTNSVLEEKLGEVHQLVSRLVSFSSTSRSELLNAKEKDLFSSETSSEEQRNLKSLFSQLHTADLVTLRIEDFLELLNTLEVEADGVKELETQAMVQNMTNLYQQHLIDGNKLLAFFQQLEGLCKKNKEI